jgi:hypothetical protein
MADKPKTTKLHQLITDNRNSSTVKEATRMAKEKDMKNKNVGIDIKWVQGLYCISFDLNDYEIVIEVKTPGSAIIPSRDETIGVYYNGIECTHSFVDQKTGTTITPNGTNLARLMALVIKKDEEES